MKTIVQVTRADLEKLRTTPEQIGHAVAQALCRIDMGDQGDLYIVDPEVEVVVADWSSTPAVDGYRADS
jgi:hypothetical protein